MPTIQQLIRTPRKTVDSKTKSPALKNCPQRQESPESEKYW